MTATTVQSTMRASFGWLLTGGILATLLGLFLLIFPTFASVSVTLFVGWSLLFAAAIGIVAAFVNRAEGGLFVGLLLGILAGITGFFLIFNVLAGTITLTMLLAIWLIADGAIGTVSSLVSRPTGWVWWLFGSVLGLVLGVMLLNAMPLAAAWVLGTYAGVVMMLRGLVLIATAIEVRSLGRAA